MSSAETNRQQRVASAEVFCDTIDAAVGGENWPRAVVVSPGVLAFHTMRAQFPGIPPVYELGRHVIHNVNGMPVVHSRVICFDSEHGWLRSDKRLEPTASGSEPQIRNAGETARVDMGLIRLLALDFRNLRRPMDTVLSLLDGFALDGKPDMTPSYGAGRRVRRMGYWVMGLSDADRALSSALAYKLFPKIMKPDLDGHSDL